MPTNKITELAKSDWIGKQKQDYYEVNLIIISLLNHSSMSRLTDHDLGRSASPTSSRISPMCPCDPHPWISLLCYWKIEFQLFINTFTLYVVLSYNGCHSGAIRSINRIKYNRWGS